MEKIIAVLKKVSLFQNLSEAAIEDIVASSNATVKSYKKGAVLYYESNVCETCDVILSGAIFVQDFDSSGSSVTVKEFSVLEVFGENLLFGQRHQYPMTSFCKTETTILHLRKELILRLCGQDEQFLINFLGSVSNKTLILREKMKTIGMMSIRERITTFLLMQYQQQQNVVIQLQHSKKELAEQFGIQRTSLSRELQKMKKEELIDYNAQSITILDLKALKKNNLEP